MQAIFGSRRRFATFCDFAFVSKYTLPSITPYHIATRCGTPLGPLLASVPVLLCSMHSVISSSDITIWLRWFAPTEVSVGGNLFYCPTGCPESAQVASLSSQERGRVS